MTKLFVKKACEVLNVLFVFSVIVPIGLFLSDIGNVLDPNVRDFLFSMPINIFGFFVFFFPFLISLFQTLKVKDESWEEYNERLRKGSQTIGVSATTMMLIRIIVPWKVPLPEWASWALLISAFFAGTWILSGILDRIIKNTISRSTDISD